MGLCPLFVFQGTQLRHELDEHRRGCATRRSAWRGATGSRSSTCSSGASRSAWCCGSSSTGRTTGGVETPGGRASAIEDCQRVSQDLSALLDVEDELGERRSASVHARGFVAGLDRPLRHEADYRRFAGRLAKIVTSEPIERPERVRRTARRRRGRRGRCSRKDGERTGCRSTGSSAGNSRWSSDARSRQRPGLATTDN